MTERADLHIHTTASDGQFSPEQVVEMARNCHLRAIAITDHETTLGNRPAQRAAEGSGLIVVAGVEISTESALGELHILGYLIDPEADRLEGRLAELRQGRLKRAQEMLARLAAVGMPLDWEHVRRLAAGESVGRPHVARAMVERGYVATTDEAFALYIGHNGPAYVPRLRVLPTEAIAMIRRARGVAVLAHPLQVYPIVPELARAGLQGLETSYAGYSTEEVSFLEEVARRNGLICTGGSDFHGPAISAVEMGAATAPFATVGELERLRSVPVPKP